MSSISSKEFNCKRKELLIKKDNKEKVSNLEFGFYDLTTYYDEQSSDTLIDKILLYENEGRRIEHIGNKELYFMPEQEELLSIIKDRKRLIISAPTSFGKTLIVKEYIYREQPKNIVYIVPTNSLAYELEADFKKAESKFKNYVVFDKNSTDFNIDGNEYLLFIGTQEKFVELNNVFKKIDLFIIDEAYKLQDSTKKLRGFKLSQAFIESINNKSDRIILLTPNAKLVGFDKYNFYIYQTHFNAVDKVFHQISSSEFENVLYECAKESKTILYCDSPKDMVKIAENAKTIKETNNEFIKMLENEYHPDWSVIQLMKKGILTHHGMMPKYVQNHMIDLFLKTDDYNLLIGTNSISEGINTPTKNLFFDKECTFKKEKLLYKNTIGRAGRLGQYPIGHIYSVKDLSYLDKDEIEIKLAISDEEELEEVEENNDELKLRAVLAIYGITDEHCIAKIKSFHIPLSKIKSILKVLRNDLIYSGLDQIPNMAQMVYPAEYPQYKFNKWNRINEEKIFIKGCLQFYYKTDENNSHDLKTFSDKIDYFKYVCEKRYKKGLEQNNSNIIEGYMRFIYSTLEYCIIPIMKVGKAIIDNCSNWAFGKNVKNTITLFFDRYYQFQYGISVDNFTDNQRKILETLKEYGVSLKEIEINDEILKEIESELNVRYSTYDVIHAIIKLASEKGKYQNVYKFIRKKYIFL